MLNGRRNFAKSDTVASIYLEKNFRNLTVDDAEDQ